VPVNFPLTELLAELRKASGNPKEGFILQGERLSKPLNLHILAKKIIKPALEGVGMKWEGYYACRRGLATVASETSNAQGAAGLLRHKGIGTTVEHYIKVEDEHRKKASQAVSAKYLATRKLLKAGNE
jgi:hypothetical protein